MSRQDDSAARAVREFIGLRTAQVSLPVLLCLLLLRKRLQTERFTSVSRFMGVAITLGLSAYFQAVFHPRTTWGFPLLTRLPPDCDSRIALTFDDGPYPESTPPLLEALAAFGAKATFFLVAEQARNYPGLTRRIVEEGHTLGMHGLTHHSMAGRSARQAASELAEAERILTAAGGQPLSPRLLRPPHGFKTRTLCRTAAQLGWTLVSWSFDPGDYRGISSETLLRRCRAGIRPRDVVLLHERPDPDITLAMLPALLRFLEEQGIGTIALGELSRER